MEEKKYTCIESEKKNKSRWGWEETIQERKKRKEGVWRVGEKR